MFFWRKLPRVLFLMEKFAGGSPEWKLTNSLHNFYSSLARLKVTSNECLFFDDYYRKKGKPIDDRLLARYRRRTAMVFFSYLFYYPHNPLPETLREFRDAGVPVVCVWGDYCQHRMPAYEDVATVNLVLDTDAAGPSYLSTFTPQDPAIYYDAGLERDLGVVFAGSLDRPTRREMIPRLMAEVGCTVVGTDSTKQGCLPPEAYARWWQRARIGLNFSKAANGQDQLKGRIFEIAHCGAMILSEENTLIDKYFTEGEEYISFRDYADLKDKCWYYLSHEEERLRIARNGHRKARELYNNHAFWKTLFERAGVPVLRPLAA